MGGLAVKSQPEVIANIDVPDEDVASLINAVPFNGSRKFFLPLHSTDDRLHKMPQRDGETAYRIIATYEDLMQREQAAHDLIRNPRHPDALGTFEILNWRRKIDDSQTQIHTDSPTHYRYLLGPHGIRIPGGNHITPPGAPVSPYNSVRYLLSLGPEATIGGTRYAEGRVSRKRYDEKNGFGHDDDLSKKMHTFPTGSLVRFLSQTGVHQQNPDAHPRILINNTLWRNRHK